MLSVGVTRRVVVDFSCERDLVTTVLALLIAECVLALVDGVLERIIGVLERMISVSPSILITVVDLSVLTACFCVGSWPFRISRLDVLKLPRVPAVTVVATEAEICSGADGSSDCLHPNVHVNWYLALSERKTNIPMATTKKIVNKTTNDHSNRFLRIVNPTLRLFFS